ncbi:MAG: hypothetical protein V4583_11985 [Pseudomonadota bacterium]
MKTKRRWILSILETVGDGEDTRIVARASARQTTGRTAMITGQKGFAMRLKTATRQVSDASR